MLMAQNNGPKNNNRMNRNINTSNTSNASKGIFGTASNFANSLKRNMTSGANKPSNSSSNANRNSKSDGIFGVNLGLGGLGAAAATNGSSSSSSSSTNGKTMNSLKQFMETNSLISKIVFLLIALISFVFLFRLGLRLLNYMFGPSKSPILIDGMINANKEYTIEVNPNVNGAKPIFRSDNEDQGIEFTYAYWMYIDDIFYKQNQYRHIFHKGDDNFNDETCDKIGVSFPNNCPGAYLRPNENAMSIFLNTYDEVLEEIVVDNLPVNKWVCFVIRVQSKTVDIYANGLLVKRHNLSGTIRQNYGKVYCCKNGGYGGYLSMLRYYDHAINFNQIQHILHKGPNTQLIGNSGEQTSTTPPYLSMRWYYNEIQGGP